jgi:hypothetical protein
MERGSPNPAVAACGLLLGGLGLLVARSGLTGVLRLVRTWSKKAPKVFHAQGE